MSVLPRVEQAATIQNGDRLVKACPCAEEVMACRCGAPIVGGLLVSSAMQVHLIYHTHSLDMLRRGGRALTPHLRQCSRARRNTRDWLLTTVSDQLYIEIHSQGEDRGFRYSLELSNDTISGSNEMIQELHKIQHALNPLNIKSGSHYVTLL